MFAKARGNRLERGIAIRILRLSRELRIHRRMAHQPAELSSLHVVNGAVGRHRDQHEIHGGQHQHGQKDPPMVRNAQIDDGPVGGRSPGMEPSSARVQARAERDQQ